MCQKLICDKCNTLYDKGEILFRNGKQVCIYCNHGTEKRILPESIVAIGLVIFFFMVFLVWLAFGVGQLVHAAEADRIPVETIAYEASNQSLEAQYLVACVIRQRMLERKMTAEQVCLQPKQFSCWKNGKPTQKRKLTAREVLTAKEMWLSVKDKRAYDLPTPVNLYHDGSCIPSWTWADNVEFVCKEDNLLFYYENRTKSVIQPHST